MTKNLVIEDLIGKHVISAEINIAKDLVILNTTTGKLFLSWEGDCCAHCFLQHIEGSSLLMDAIILKAYNLEWRDISSDEAQCEVIESMGISIITTKGHINFETRLEHNGYYSGDILISDRDPSNEYNRLIKLNGQPMQPLTDF